MGADIFPGATGAGGRRRVGGADLRLLRAVWRRPPDLVRTAGGLCVDRPPECRELLRPAHPAWDLRVADLVESLPTSRSPRPVDRVISTCSPRGSASRRWPGSGSRAASSAPTSPPPPSWRKRSRRCVPSGLHRAGGTETLVRAWHVEGLAVRPRHAMVGHTGFVITDSTNGARVTAPLRKRRPAPGAYGEDYSGPPASPGRVFARRCVMTGPTMIAGV